MGVSGGRQTASKVFKSAAEPPFVVADFLSELSSVGSIEG